MAKYSTQDVLETLNAHLEVLQRTLNIHEPQPGLMRSVKAGQALSDASSQLVQLLGSKELLQRELSLLMAALEELPIGVIAFGENGLLLLYNRAAEEILGGDSMELPFDMWPSQLGLYRSDTDEAPMAVEELPFYQAIVKEEIAETAVFARTPVRPEGAWLKIAAFPVSNDQGKAGAVCIIEDMTTARLERSVAPIAGAVSKPGRGELIIDRSTEAFVSIDTDGRITDWNDAAQAVLGFTADEVVGVSIRECIVPPAYRTLFDAALGQLFEKGRAGEAIGRAEVPSLHIDGKEHIIRLSVFYFGDENGESMGGFFEDVTQKIRVEQRRNARSSVTRLLAESSSFEDAAPRLVQSITANIDWEIGLIWLVDPTSKVLRCSQVWHQNPALDAFVRRNQELGIAPGKGVLGRVWQKGECEYTIDTAALGDDPQAKLAELANLHSSVAFPVVSNWELEAILQFFHNDASEPDEELLQLMIDFGNQTSQFADATRAIIARQRLMAMVETSEDALISLSLAGIITSWNGGAEKIYDWDAVSIIGRDVSVLFGSDHEQESRQLIADVRATRAPKKLEARHVTREGMFVDVDVTVSPVLDSAGKVIAIGFTAHDISEHKLFEQRVEALNAEIAEQAGRLATVNKELRRSHDSNAPAKEEEGVSSEFKSAFLTKMDREIRTPMNAIIGLSEVLSKSKSLTRQEEEYVSIIRESGATLLNAFNDIIDYSKIEDGNLQLESAEFSLTEVIEQAADSTIAQTFRKRLSITTFVSPEIPSLLRGDADKLGKVLVKLLESTFKYMERGGVIIRAVPASVVGNRCWIRIVFSDVGVGLSAISRAQMQKSLELDHQAPEFDATKVGLSLTKHLVEAMGGSIGIEPNNTGNGVSFWSVLPFDRAADLSPAVPDPSFAGRKVLVVDGPTGVGRIVHAYADAWGLSCDWVLTGDEAVALLRNQAAANMPYDIAVIENVAFGMSGRALVEAIKWTAELEDTDILFYGPFLDDKDVAELSEFHVSAVLRGPLKESQLRSCITEILQHRRTQAALPSADALVLVADDNELNRKVTVLQLQSFGLTAQVVNSGAEAVQAADQDVYALILMSTTMLDMDGMTAARAIRRIENSRGRRTPIVAVTHDASESNRQQCMQSGMDDYLTYPVETGQLGQIVRKWIPAHLLGDLAPAATEDNEPESDTLDPRMAQPFPAASSVARPASAARYDLPAQPVPALPAPVAPQAVVPGEEPAIEVVPSSVADVEAMLDEILDEVSAVEESLADEPPVEPLPGFLPSSLRTAPLPSFPLSPEPAPVPAPPVAPPSVAALFSEPAPTVAPAPYVAPQSLAALFSEPEPAVAAASPVVPASSAALFSEPEPTVAPAPTVAASSAALFAQPESVAPAPPVAPMSSAALFSQPFAQPEAAIPAPPVAPLSSASLFSQPFSAPEPPVAPAPPPAQSSLAALLSEPSVSDVPEPPPPRFDAKSSPPFSSTDEEVPIYSSPQMAAPAVGKTTMPPGDELMNMGLDELQEIAEKLLFEQQAAADAESSQEYSEQAEGPQPETVDQAEAMDEPDFARIASDIDEIAAEPVVASASIEESEPQAPPKKLSLFDDLDDEFSHFDVAQTIPPEAVIQPVPVMELSAPIEAPTPVEPSAADVPHMQHALFGESDDDLDEGFVDQSPVAPVVPAAEATPVANSVDQVDSSHHPSAELAALFDSVIDEELREYDSAHPSEFVAGAGDAPSGASAAPIDPETLKAQFEAELRNIKMSAGPADGSISSEEASLREVVETELRNLLAGENQEESLGNGSSDIGHAKDDLADLLNTSDRALAGEGMQSPASAEELDAARRGADELPYPSASAQQATFEQYLKRAQKMQTETEALIQHINSQQSDEVEPAAAQTQAAPPPAPVPTAPAETRPEPVAQPTLENTRPGQMEQAPAAGAEPSAVPLPPFPMEFPSQQARRRAVVANQLLQSLEGAASGQPVPASPPPAPPSIPSNGEGHAAAAPSVVPTPVPAPLPIPAMPPAAQVMPAGASQPPAPPPPAPPPAAPAAPAIAPPPAPVPSPAVMESPSDSTTDADAEMDLSRLQRICGETGMKELIDEFLISSQRNVDELELAVLMKDDGERRRLSHELTGSAGLLGAKQVQKFAAEMQSATDDDWEKKRLILKQLKQSYDSLKVLLIAYARQSG